MSDPLSRDESSPVVVPPNALPAAVLESATGPLFCPNSATPLWSAHPRVYLEVNASGEARCPYCSTLYQLSAGAAHAPSGGH